MIVRQFLQWIRTAPAGERADATSALARAFLYSDLSADDSAAAEGAMLMLLDDPASIVRGALAQSLAASEDAPPAVIFALAQDQIDVARPVLERSPLLVDTDLVDILAAGESAVQVAIARRLWLPRSVAAALAEVGTVDACLALAENASAEIAPLSFDRLIVRHGDQAPIREALLARGDLPAVARQALMVRLSQVLTEFVVAREWLPPERAQRIVREARERATVTLAAGSPPPQLRPMVQHLRESGQLNAALMLRALLSGNIALFEEALSELADVPLPRVVRIVHDRGGTAFHALYERAGLPESAFPGFHEALAVIREIDFTDGIGSVARLKRQVVERVLTDCAECALGDVGSLLTLLRRFAAEAAREEARSYCEELAEADTTAPALIEDQRIAA